MNSLSLWKKLTRFQNNFSVKTYYFQSKAKNSELVNSYDWCYLGGISMSLAFLGSLIELVFKMKHFLWCIKGNLNYSSPT